MLFKNPIGGCTFQRCSGQRSAPWIAERSTASRHETLVVGVSTSRSSHIDRFRWRGKTHLMVKFHNDGSFDSPEYARILCYPLRVSIAKVFVLYLVSHRTSPILRTLNGSKAREYNASEQPQRHQYNETRTTFLLSCATPLPRCPARFRKFPWNIVQLSCHAKMHRLVVSHVVLSTSYKGSLLTYALDPDFAPIPPYEALSYVWGTEAGQVSIHVDGRPIAIKQNLDSALRSLRLPTQARRVWVDALCIDQSNIEERSRQVRYIRFVYKHATRVVVWLGCWTPGVEMAFELAERLAVVRESCGADKVSLQKAVVELAEGAPEAFDHLNRLFDRPYFLRNWCIQEVVASSGTRYCSECHLNSGI
ncbi:predicted protein [Histoplasma mississippiense (nom. inval.)]|uniref:predicted protein n=1 Tax=Ajellomyces capsulatus (strain NAm1 / WU24) TaxID=2059318 RepID=UPI000157C2C0|nr:predicted protein [Histoplasma mississippiense (nom. inval.)]EDN07881.1 predicted protein [Histoplasma mississippiense (nom. inval.)]